MPERRGAPCSTQELDLADNGVGDDGCLALAEALPKCPTLKSLSLVANLVSDAAATRAAAALEDAAAQTAANGEMRPPPAELRLSTDAGGAVPGILWGC